jgi:hypothetical protein
MTVGSRSTMIARGTFFPVFSSSKKASVLLSQKLASLVSKVFVGGSGEDSPLGKMPCSRQYNCQHFSPNCTPAWPMWIEIHSRWRREAWHIVVSSAFKETGRNISGEILPYRFCSCTESLITMMGGGRRENLAEKRECCCLIRKLGRALGFTYSLSD